MNRNQVYVLLAALLVFVVFLSGLYWNSLSTSRNTSITMEPESITEPASGTEITDAKFSPLLITTTTPIVVGAGEVLPTSVSTFEVTGVEYLDNQLNLTLNYAIENNPAQTIKLSIIDIVNVFDSQGEMNQVLPINLPEYISLGDRLSVDFFSNSMIKPVAQDQLQSFFVQSGLSGENQKEAMLVPVDVDKLEQTLHSDGAVIDPSEFRVITMRKIAQ